MNKHKILESFRWLPPGDMRVTKGAGKKVIIKGRALFAGTVSRNMRKYVKEELVRAARTLVGKPVTINHDPKRIVGHVIDAEEEENAIEYVAEVNKHPYIQRLLDRKSLTAESYFKKWMVDPISGVSVEADYRHNRCVECGESFYNQETFEGHMWDIHKVKNFKFEPRGILMKALSLVEPPEKPGVQGTTIELMETNQSMSQLMETLTTDLKNEMEYKQKMSRVVVSPEKHVVPIAAKLKEQKEPCPEGQHRNEEGKCVADTPETKEQTQQELPAEHVEPPKHCPDGYEDDGAGGCKPAEWFGEPTAKPQAPLIVPEPTIDLPKVDVPTPAPASVTGPVLEQDTTLPPTPFPSPLPKTPAVLTGCPEGSHLDQEANTCVPDSPTPTVVSDLVKEFKLPTLLKLAEPCDWSKAGYSSYDDCESKNQDKGDPSAYCADVRRKLMGETFRETYDPERGYVRQLKLNEDLVNIAKTVDVLNEATAKIIKELAKAPEAINEAVVSESKLRAGYDREITRQLQTIPKAIETSNTSIVEYIKKVAEKQTRYFAGLVRSLSECSRKNDASIATFAKGIKEQVEKQKQDYEKILNAIDDKYGEFKENYKTLEQRLKEQEEELEKRKCGENEHYDEEQGKCVPNEESEETREMREKLAKLEGEKEKSLKETESLTVRVDNLEAKQKGTFKGHSKQVDKKKDVSYGRPGKEMRDSAKKGK